MSTLGFDNYVEPLKLYLQKYRESMKGEKQPGEGFEEIDDVICTLTLGALIDLILNISILPNKDLPIQIQIQ